MRSVLPMRTVQGTVPHVWVDFFVYTYKFTFDWCIITTQMSFLYAPTTSACRTSPTTSDHFRRLQTSELLRRLPTISDDFRFPNHCSPTEPIRGLPNNTPHLHDSRDQTNPQCCSILWRCKLKSPQNGNLKKRIIHLSRNITHMTYTTFIFVKVF